MVTDKIGGSKKTVELAKTNPVSKPATETRYAGIAAYSDGRGVYLSWQMEVEVANLGFQVFRMRPEGGVDVVNPEMILGSARRARTLPIYGETYEFYDSTGSSKSTYYVEAWDATGGRVTSSTVVPQSIPSLKSVAGKTSVELAAQNAILPQSLESSKLIYTTKELLQEMEDSRVEADPTTHRAVISQPGVRFTVKVDGLYRVTRTQLQNAGFNVQADPATWQLYADGIEQPIIVPGDGSYVEFLGKGVDTVETDLRTYYLIAGATAGRRMQTRVAPPSQSTVVTPTYFQTFVKKDRQNYVEDIFNGDAENYWGRSVNVFGSSPMTFNLSGIDFTQPTVAITVSFLGYSAGDHVTEVTFNNTVLGNATGTLIDPYAATFIVPTSLLIEGANTLKFKALNGNSDSSFFDTVNIEFNRKFQADQNTLRFYTQNYRVAKLTGFTSANVRVFDTTRDGEPVEVTNLTFQQDGATFGTNMPGARARTFYAVENGAALAPDSITPNNPELLSLPTNQADLIIITHKDFLVQSEAWAQYRRNQGFTAKVIEVSELYDEFNYGTISSQSIKDFLEYAYTNWGGGTARPKYVMLMGDASWDGRNYENRGYFNMVPAKFVTTVYLETASDEALADFNSDGLAELPIGRISARTTAEVDIAFSKTVNWEAALTPTSLETRGSLFAYDHNNGFNFSGMSTDVRNQLPGTVPATFVYRGETNANQNLIDGLNTGKFIVNYAGHGTAGSWGGNPTFFNVFSVDTLSPHAPGIYTMLTCLNGYYHWLYNPSIAEKLLFAPNKGAVAAWGSSGLTTPDIQRDMAIRFYLKLGEGQIARMGDLVNDAKSTVPGSSDVRYSWALIGDPMLKVR
jgi:hypothetical protein